MSRHAGAHRLPAVAAVELSSAEPSCTAAAEGGEDERRESVETALKQLLRNDDRCVYALRVTIKICWMTHWRPTVYCRFHIKVPGLTPPSFPEQKNLMLKF